MRIGIFSNEIKDKGNNEALKLSEMLTVNGAEVFLFNNTDRPYLKSIISDSDIDLLTVLGGDAPMLYAALFSPDGAERVDGQARIDGSDAATSLAADLLARAPRSITDHFTGPA